MSSLYVILSEINKPKALWFFLVLFLTLGLIIGTAFLIRYCSIKMREMSPHNEEAGHLADESGKQSGAGENKSA